MQLSISNVLNYSPQLFRVESDCWGCTLDITKYTNDRQAYIDTSGDINEVKQLFQFIAKGLRETLGKPSYFIRSNSNRDIIARIYLKALPFPVVLDMIKVHDEIFICIVNENFNIYEFDKFVSNFLEIYEAYVTGL